MFGSHLSISGGMENALIEAQELGMDCVQVFTKNQRQWKVAPLKPEQVDAWHEHRASTGIEHVVSHDSYLINLASPDDAARDKSMALYREEMLRCDVLDIPWLVMHPGAHMKSGEEAGIERIVQSFDQLHAAMPKAKVITCIETTAGQGTTLGASFVQIAAIIEGVEQDHRLAVCIDTAHLLAAGYDLTSEEGAAATLEQLNDIVGLDRVKVAHLNDSKTKRGSRVDRHEHIGHGHVALEAFRTIVRHPAMRDIPKILETAKEQGPGDEAWDIINLRTLRDLLEDA